MTTEKQMTHLDDKGQAHMVDVSGKNITERIAVAKGELRVSAATMRLLLDDGLPKGDAVATARVAGIQAVKKTADLIPLCHPIQTRSIKVFIEPDRDRHVIEVTCRVKVEEKTGVEMEALTGASVSLLTLYDMLKSVQKDMVIGNVKVIEKTGGKSGDYRDAR